MGSTPTLGSNATGRVCCRAVRGGLPIGLTLGVPPQFIAAFSTAAIGIYFFPANGSQVIAIATDETGTTHISKFAIWHSFSLPMFVMWLVSTVVGCLVALLVYGST